MSSSCCNFLNIPGPIRITVDTCHFLSVALFMEYSLTIKWQPASLDKLMDTFPPFFASTEERLEERVITLSSFSLSVDARKEECIHQFPTCHLTLDTFEMLKPKGPPYGSNFKKIKFFQ